MQRHGQVVLFAQVGQAANFGGQADRGDGDMPCADVQSILAAGYLKRFEQVIEVGQGLAHPHDNDVREPLAGRQEVSQAD